MSELTLVFDDWGHKELKDYLLSLKGINNVLISDDDYRLIINLKYDSKTINYQVIIMEILLFLNHINMPTLIAFDKHPKNPTSNYKIVRHDTCCEFCFRGAIQDLYNIDGIEAVSSNINKYYDTINDKDIIISINYNPNIISLEKIKEIDANLII